MVNLQVHERVVQDPDRIVQDPKSISHRILIGFKRILTVSLIGF